MLSLLYPRQIEAPERKIASFWRGFGNSSA
jgi:hypothetical protein